MLNVCRLGVYRAGSVSPPSMLTKRSSLMTRCIAAAALVVLIAAPIADAAYPKPPARYLATPFAGKPLPGVWFGKWRETGSSNDGVVWQFFGRSAPACKALVAGHTTCFVLRPPGVAWIDGGAATLDGPRLVLRMTYRGHPQTVGCFTNDEYGFRILSTKILILKGAPRACFWQRSAEHFPIHLDSIR